MQELIEALREHVSDEPPLRLTSADVLTAGRASRRRRRLAGAFVGVSVATVAVLAVIVGGPHLPNEPPPPDVGSHRPNEARCAQLTGPASDHLSREEAADRLSCYLTSRVRDFFPVNAHFLDNEARPGTEALVAGPDPTGDGSGVAATALVRDPEGTGTILFAVSRISPGTAEQRAESCGDPRATSAPSGSARSDGQVNCRTGPHSEHVEVYDTGRGSDGIHSRTVYVYSAGTLILAGADNSREADPHDPTRWEPPLTVNQLIDLACATALQVYG